MTLLRDSVCDWEQFIAGHAGSSPFSWVIALDFYDGPTEGVAWSETWAAAVVFEMLDWDASRELRVFWITRLRAGAFGRIVDACLGAGVPRWPDWSPIWNFKSDQGRVAAERAVDEALAERDDGGCIVLTRNLLTEIVAVKVDDGQDRPGFEAWTRFLGLSAEV